VLSNYYFTGKNKTSQNPDGNLRESLIILRRHGACGGAISDIYRYIFERYDLAGCLDTPPSASPALVDEWNQVCTMLKTIFGPDMITYYNLGWISRQRRHLPFI
jgi:hypothetical protein